MLHHYTLMTELVLPMLGLLFCAAASGPMPPAFSVSAALRMSRGGRLRGGLRPLLVCPQLRGYVELQAIGLDALYYFFVDMKAAHALMLPQRGSKQQLLDNLAAFERMLASTPAPRPKAPP